MCLSCDWKRALERILEIKDPPDIVLSIEDWIENHEHVTPRQLETIENIWADQ